VVPTHLAFEHDNFLAPFSEHAHVIPFRNDVQHLDGRRASRARLRMAHPS